MWSIDKGKINIIKYYVKKLIIRYRYKQRKTYLTLLTSLKLCFYGKWIYSILFYSILVIPTEWTCAIARFRDYHHHRLQVKCRDCVWLSLIYGSCVWGGENLFSYRCPSRRKIFFHPLVIHSAGAGKSGFLHLVRLTSAARKSSGDGNSVLSEANWPTTPSLNQHGFAVVGRRSDWTLCLFVSFLSFLISTAFRITMSR